jgi:hypothetical protein
VANDRFGDSAFAAAALRTVDVRLVEDHQPRPPKIARQLDERLGKEAYEPAGWSRLMVPGRFAHFDALTTAVVSLLGGRARALDRGCIGHQHNVVPFESDLFEAGTGPFHCDRPAIV